MVALGVPARQSNGTPAGPTVSLANCRAPEETSDRAGGKMEIRAIPNSPIQQRNRMEGTAGLGRRRQGWAAKEPAIWDCATML
jgi:hypothetical protein